MTSRLKPLMLMFVLLAGLGPWRAFMVFLVTSPERPMGLMVAQLPGEFATESECRKFLRDMEPKVARTIRSYMSARLAGGAKILDHNLTCVLPGGEGA